MRRKRSGVVKRSIPAWLLSNDAFLQEMDAWFDAWWHGGQLGFARVHQFVKEV